MTQGEWISTDHGPKPREGQRVLVSLFCFNALPDNNWNHVCICRYEHDPIDGLHYKEEGGELRAHAATEAVTHWQPLPEAIPMYPMRDDGE